MNDEHDDLERELRALREEPSEEWASKMDERASKEIARRPRRRLNLNVLGPVAAGSLAAVVAVVIVASGGRDDEAPQQDVLQTESGAGGEL
ncbi:MAG: hypothetical protein H0V29_08925, partial [Thermoleophilaceae bacterium]|nr:hypothetical protein [Thermoleophilaceae bacterium]